MKEKGDLNEKQQAFIKHKTATLDRINNPFPRSNQPLYQGQSHILIGVAIGLEKSATVAVVIQYALRKGRLKASPATS
jgi:hypothetical protein